MPGEDAEDGRFDWESTVTTPRHDTNWFRFMTTRNGTSGAVFGSLAWAATLCATGCTVRLDDTNLPLPNGAVSGAAADCSVVIPLPQGAPGVGPATPKYVGRYDLADPLRPRFDWSGNYVEARFFGTGVSIGITVGQPVLFAAVLDGGDPVVFRAVAGQTAYELAGNLPLGEHVVRVHRNTEALSGGVVSFDGLIVQDGMLLPPIERLRGIEVIGDSITCGYGNQGDHATCPFDVPVPDVPGARLPVTENQYLAYGSLAGRALDADVTTVCWSGKGVFQNLRDVPGDPVATTTLPTYYGRTVGSEPSMLPWGFSGPEPTAIVINLGTNDFSRDNDTDGIPDGLDLASFEGAYANFIRLIRSKRPNAHIFLAVSPMVSNSFPSDGARSNFRTSLDRIVADAAAAGDAKVYSMELVDMGSRYGLGCDYHPNLEVHRIMADQVVGAIRTKTCW